MTASFLYSDFVIRASFVIRHCFMRGSCPFACRAGLSAVALCVGGSFSEGGWLDFVSAGRRSRDSLDRCGASVSRGFVLR